MRSHRVLHSQPGDRSGAADTDGEPAAADATADADLVELVLLGQQLLLLGAEGHDLLLLLPLPRQA